MGDIYYERYFGDYAKDTRRLSLAEHGAYTLLLDDYYSPDGGPLPAAMEALYRICGCQDDSERAAVRTVAAKYFPVNKADNLRHNKRADKQLAERAAFKAEQSRKGKLSGVSRRKPRLNCGSTDPSTEGGTERGTETQPYHRHPPSPSVPPPAPAPVPPTPTSASTPADGFAYQGERLTVSKIDHARLCRLYPLAFLLEQYPQADVKFAGALKPNEEVTSGRCWSWVSSWCERSWSRIKRDGEEGRYQGAGGKGETIPHGVTFNPKGQAYKDGKRAPEFDCQ